jgi:hypothetical protein
MYPLALETYREKLESAAPDLFVEDEDEDSVEVCFRDLEVEGVGRTLP